MIICGVIPVRLDSSRFPGKALAKLAGKEIILHVWERARRYPRFERLIVATDSEHIAKLIERQGGEVWFSTKAFRNGSERVAAAVEDIRCDVCVNIQGDEVMIDSPTIEATVVLLEKDKSLQVATAAYRLDSTCDPHNRNLVKVTVDDGGGAKAFSRTVINESGGEGCVNFGHIGIYAYRRDFLLRYPELTQTSGEIEHSLEQLRILESGIPIGVKVVDKPLLSINTPEDLKTAERILAGMGEVPK